MRSTLARRLPTAEGGGGRSEERHTKRERAGERMVIGIMLLWRAGDAETPEGRAEAMAECI